jgi:3-oxoacyl-[acyl-carrier protein] reductase
MLLKNKVALITGAARGIGRVTAFLMAQEGAAVGLADIREEIELNAKEIRMLDVKSEAAIIDVSDPDSVKKGVDKVRKTLGDIDILVNNAGIVNNISPLTKMAYDSWQREIAVNLTGTFNMIKAVIDPMIVKKWGRIINISSGAATMGLHNQAAYSASKAGILGLTKTVTLEHGRDGICCNAVLPGLIATELVSSMPKEILNRSIANTPALRLGEMKEIGHVIVFLASDQASFINGAEIHVDGGLGLNTSSLGSRKEIRERYSFKS